jgi:hypothetical protein
MCRHEVARLVHAILDTAYQGLPGHDVANDGAMGIQRPGHAAHDDVPIADRADQLPVLDHGHAADILLAHHASRERQRRTRADDDDLARHHVPDQHGPLPPNI